MKNILSFILLFSFTLQAKDVLVGAIRWDAWMGIGPGVEVERSLGPNHWHSRLPFYAKEIDSNKVEIRANTQAIIDQEIAYAKNARIDYFAYVVYYDSMKIARELHMKSAHKSDVKFCYIFDQNAFANWPTHLSWMVSSMMDPDYQKVDGGRPLLYSFESSGSSGQVQELSNALVAAGSKQPFVVDFGSSISFADAHSTYAIFGGSGSGAPFSELVNNAKKSWESYSQGIPCVSTGWDGRPRVENPPFWVTHPSDYNAYYLQGTPLEIAGELGQAIEYVQANPAKCKANTVLIYAWNENDEGGWIVPLLPKNGGSERLDAIAKVITAHSTSITDIQSNKIPKKSAALKTGGVSMLRLNPLTHFDVNAKGQSLPEKIK